MGKEFLNRFAADLAALLFNEPRLGEAQHRSMEFRCAHAEFTAMPGVEPRAALLELASSNVPLLRVVEPVKELAPVRTNAAPPLEITPPRVVLPAPKVTPLMLPASNSSSPKVWSAVEVGTMV